MPRANTKAIKKEKKKIQKGFFDQFALSDTLILAAIPFASYAIVFFYERGYFSIFKIPIEFISFDLSRVFLAMLTVITFSASVYYFSQILVDMFTNYPEPIKQRLNKQIYIFVLSTILMFFVTSDWKLRSYILLFLIINSAPPFIIPLFTQRKVKGYIAKLKAADKRENQNTKDDLSMSPIMKLAKLLGKKFFLGLFSFIFILFITYQLGVGAALTQKEFQILNTNPERVVLWIYNDYALSASFNRVTKEVDASFIVIRIGENPNIEYKFEEIGPLKLKKTPPDNVSTNTPAPTPTIITTSTP